MVGVVWYYIIPGWQLSLPFGAVVSKFVSNASNELMYFTNFRSNMLRERLSIKRNLLMPSVSESKKVFTLKCDFSSRMSNVDC